MPFEKFIKQKVLINARSQLLENDRDFSDVETAACGEGLSALILLFSLSHAIFSALSPALLVGSRGIPRPAKRVPASVSWVFPGASNH